MLTRRAQRKTIKSLGRSHSMHLFVGHYDKQIAWGRKTSTSVNNKKGAGEPSIVSRFNLGLSTPSIVLLHPFAATIIPPYETPL